MSDFPWLLKYCDMLVPGWETVEHLVVCPSLNQPSYCGLIIIKIFIKVDNTLSKDGMILTFLWELGLIFKFQKKYNMREKEYYWNLTSLLSQKKKYKSQVVISKICDFK